MNQDKIISKREKYEELIMLGMLVASLIIGNLLFPEDLPRALADHNSISTIRATLLVLFKGNCAILVALSAVAVIYSICKKISLIITKKSKRASALFLILKYEHIKYK